MDEAHETEALRVLPASGLLVLNGVLFLTFATRRFYTVQRTLLAEQFPVIGRKLMALLATTSLTTVAALFVVADPGTTGLDWRPDEWKQPGGGNQGKHAAATDTAPAAAPPAPAK